MSEIPRTLIGISDFMYDFAIGPPTKPEIMSGFGSESGPTCLRNTLP